MNGHWKTTVKSARSHVDRRRAGFFGTEPNTVGPEMKSKFQARSSGASVEARSNRVTSGNKESDRISVTFYGAKTVKVTFTDHL